LIEVNISFDVQKREVIRNGRGIECPKFLCASGLPEIVIEYRDETSLRARAENQQWLERKKTISPDRIPSAEAIRMVQLTIDKSDSPEVGGAIDAITLDKSGTVQWLKWKDNCPKQSD
jgi:hypothetical protein